VALGVRASWSPAEKHPARWYARLGIKDCVSAGKSIPECRDREPGAPSLTRTQIGNFGTPDFFLKA
jgi:hypothetical protein